MPYIPKPSSKLEAHFFDVYINRWSSSKRKTMLFKAFLTKYLLTVVQTHIYLEVPVMERTNAEELGFTVVDRHSNPLCIVLNSGKKGLASLGM